MIAANRINLNESCLSESIQIILKNSVSLELTGLIRIDWIQSDCKFVLILINSDWPDSFELQFRIDFEWVSGLFGLKNFCGLNRN